VSLRARLDGAALGDSTPSVLETTLLPDGEHELTVEARDSAGNMAQTKIHFSCDNTPPSFELARPLDVSDTQLSRDSTIPLVASTSEPADLTFEVNGRVIEAQANALDLRGFGGQDEIHIRAVASDPAGNQSILERRVLLISGIPAFVSSASYDSENRRRLSMLAVLPVLAVLFLVVVQWGPNG
jgi:hypothetical protein